MPRLPALLLLLAASSLAAAVMPTAELPELRVYAERLPAEAGEIGFAETRFGADEIAAHPARRLDTILSAAPGFSLFRRSTSEVAHPTTQGVTLRNLGPNGAGRALVLLDGIPQNDPFGGWVYWNRLPPEMMGEVRLLRGGGSGPWGNAALGGVIDLRAAPAAASSAFVAAGSHRYREANGQLAAPIGPASATLRANRFLSPEYPVVRRDLRGPIDEDAFSRSWLVDGELRGPLSETTKGFLRFGRFEERRGNGTPLARNSSQADDYSGGLDFDLANGAGLALRAYWQERAFASTFTSANAERTAETLALDQYRVPAQAGGGSAIYRTDALVAGIDYRQADGETRERFRLIDGRFRSDRVAGGQQAIAGIFAERLWRIQDSMTVGLGGRIDRWEQTRGRRVELDLDTGEPLREEFFADRNGWVFNGRVGGAAQIDASWRSRAAAYTGFRLPTLNELYRPFRVRNDITEANPELEAERLYGAEAGLDWAPAAGWRFGATGFVTRLDRPIANVTVAQGPGNVPGFGFIPAGGVGRQRQNLGRARSDGLELQATWEALPALRVTGAALLTRSRVASSPRMTTLEGKRLAQAPGLQATLSTDWKIARQWSALGQVRYTGRQYEDDLNTARLGAYAVADLAVRWRPGEGLELFAAIENLFDTVIETGKPGGLVTVGAPRHFTIGTRASW
jgi:outer membrane receptor protein involved in Fe transport